MESFAVKCPVPEVFSMLMKLGHCHDIKGLNASHTYTSPYIYFNFRNETEPRMECGNGSVLEPDAVCKMSLLTIEQAIAELTKPREKPLMVGAHKVTINPDRSFTVGCTTVPAEVCDEIEKRRAMKGASDVYSYSVGVCSGRLYRLANGQLQDFIDSRGWGDRSELGVGLTSITEAEARQRFPEAFKE